MAPTNRGASISCYTVIVKKLIAFDMDGTLTESKEAMTAEMAALVRRLLAKTKVVVISGGGIENFFLQLEALLQSEDKSLFRNLTLLPTGGAQVYRYDATSAQWQQSAALPFPAELKQQVTTVFEQVIAADNYDIPKEVFGIQIEDRGTQMSFAPLGVDAPLALKKVWDPDHQKRSRIVRDITPFLPGATIVIGGTTHIDISAGTFDKGTALLQLLKKEQLAKDDIVYVGDALFPGGNDERAQDAGIECIQVAGPTDTAVRIEAFLKAGE